MAPLARFLAPGPPAPTPADLLAEAFRWGEWRTVTKTATVVAARQPLRGRPGAGRGPGRAGVRPVRPDRHHRAPPRPPRREGACRSRSGATCTPRPPPTPAPAPTPTGIDYLRLVEDRHTRSLGERLHYAQLADPAQPEPAQPTELPVASQAAADAAPVDPPSDRDGLTYSADLLTLADSAAPDTEESR